MAFKHYKHLNVPDSWERYFTKYPQGMTILESLFEWVSQVDSMVDNQNKLNANVEQFRNEIDAFVGRFDERLQTEVAQTLTDWQESGFLNVVIAEGLQWQLDEYITTNEQDKLSMTAQLDEATAQLKETAVHISSFPKLGAEVDDTARIQRALDYGAANKLNVYGSPNETYLVSSVRIKNGLKSFISRGTIKGTGTSSNGIVSLDGSNLFNGTPVDNCYVSLDIDMSNGDSFGIKADGCTNCTFENNNIYGMTDNISDSRYGIYLHKGSNYNKIINNKLVGFENRTNPSNAIIMIAIFGESVAYGGFFNNGLIVPPITPCIGNIITNNTVIYGEVAVDLLGCEGTLVANNYLYKQTTRSVYLASSSNRNIITANTILGFGASAVVMGFGAYKNTFSDNICKQIMGYNHHAGEAAVNITTGAYENIITGNEIESITHYGVYLAVNVIGNIVDGNKISQYYIAAIALENDFQDNPPPNALFSRPNYAPPLMGNVWASKDSEGNVIQNNIIGASYPGRQIGSIYVSQLGTTKTKNNVIQNNVMTHEQQANNWPIYFFEETNGNLIDNTLVNNTIKNGNILRCYFSRGKEHFKKCVGNDVIDTAQTFFPVGNTTPSVGKGLRFLCNNATPIEITHFTEGIDGQTIHVKLNTNTTIMYDGTKIFTKGSVNVTGTSNNNDWITFVKDGTRWREMSRSF